MAHTWFVGSTHGYADDFAQQKKAILAADCEYVLSEQLQNLRAESPLEYKKLLKEKLTEEDRKLIVLCARNRKKLVGIDLKEFGFTKHLQAVVDGKEKATPEDKRRLNDILKRRVARQLNMTQRYTRISKKSVVVIVGAWHLRKGSPLRKAFSHYTLVYPCDKEGNMLLKPERHIEFRTKVF